MNTIYLHIYNNFSVKMVFFEKNNQIFSISSNEIIGDELNLKIEDFQNLKINIYPNNKNLLPYSVGLVVENNSITATNDFATLYSLPENNYILKLKQISFLNDNISGNKIEVDSLNLKKLTFLKDLKGRGKVETFSVLNNELAKNDNYFVLLNKKEQNLTNELVLLDFFQSIFAEDFSHAKTLLAPSFAQKLSKDLVNEFFGKFEFCKLVNYFSCPCVVLFYENEAKVFGANLVDNKISDIYQIN